MLCNQNTLGQLSWGGITCFSLDYQTVAWWALLLPVGTVHISTGVFMDFVPCKNYSDVGHLKLRKMRLTTGFTQGYSHEREEKDENQFSMPSVFCRANIWKPFLLSKHGPVPESRGILSSPKRRSAEHQSSKAQLPRVPTLAACLPVVSRPLP